MTLTGFPANTKVAVACHDSQDSSFYTAYLPTDAKGDARDTTSCYS